MKEKILETVSTLRQLLVKIKISGERKLSEINNLTKKVSMLESELQSCSDKRAEVQQKPSIADTTEQSGLRAKTHGMTSSGGGCAERGPAYGQHEQTIRNSSQRNETHEIQDDSPF